jgi:hypothetical protein
MKKLGTVLYVTPQAYLSLDGETVGGQKRRNNNTACHSTTWKQSSVSAIRELARR